METSSSSLIPNSIYPYAVLLNANGAGPMDKCTILNYELSAQSPILGCMPVEPAIFAFCKNWVGIEGITIGSLGSVPQTLSLWVSIFNSHDKVNVFPEMHYQTSLLSVWFSLLISKIKFQQHPVMLICATLIPTWQWMEKTWRLMSIPDYSIVFLCHV